MENKKKLEHVAIIMDGNGRWAEREGVKRVEGHRAGAQALKGIVDATIEQDIRYLTVYAFSTENWNRSPSEVNALMSLLRDFVDNDLKEIHEKNIRINVIGQIDRIPWPTRRKLLKAVETTKDNTGGVLTLALSYGSREEIVSAIKKIAQKVSTGEISISDIDDSLINSSLYTSGMPDPDLVIRTSGEERISNFLLWQIAYAEFYFTPVLWPDFNEAEMAKALKNFANRTRRFGKTDEQLKEEK